MVDKFFAKFSKGDFIKVGPVAYRIFDLDIQNGEVILYLIDITSKAKLTIRTEDGKAFDYSEIIRFIQFLKET